MKKSLAFSATLALTSVMAVLWSMGAEATLMRYSGDLTVNNTGGLTEFSIGDTFSFQFELEDSIQGAYQLSGVLTNFTLARTGGSGTWNTSGGSFADGNILIQNANTNLQLVSTASGFQAAGGQTLQHFGFSFNEPSATTPINDPSAQQTVAQMFGGGLDMNAFSTRSASFGFGITPFGSNVRMDLSNLTSSSVSAVPVPAAVWLMGSALVGLAGFRRKKA